MDIKNRILFLTIFFAGLIQATSLHYISIAGAKPDILLICVIFFSLYYDRDTAFKAAMLAGVMKDATSMSLFGSSVFSFCVCVLLLDSLKGFLYKRSLSTQILLSGLLYFVSTAIILLINFIAKKDSGVGVAFYAITAIKVSCYTGLIAPALFFILVRLFRLKEVHI